MHISIEGMDGVGKTTVANILSGRTGYRFVLKNLSELFDGEGSEENYIRIRDRVNAEEDRLFTAWFYGLGNIYLRTKHAGEDIITDRYYLSNYAWSGTEKNEAVYGLLVRMLGVPELTVILYADEDTLRRRLMGRGAGDRDLLKVPLAREKYEKMIFFCERFSVPYMLIDTSGISAGEVAERIMKRIEGRP